MSQNLFQKAAIITDLHFGRNANNPVSLQDNIDFIQWFIDESKTRDIDTCIMMGDWHDNRHTIHASTMHISSECIKMLNNAFKTVWWIPGNHDLHYRDSRQIASSSILCEHLSNIRIVNDPLIMDDVIFLPWLVNDEHKSLSEMKSRYVFSHLELPGFMMNAKVEMQEHENSIKLSSLHNHEAVFSGHFHIRQTKKNVIYTGNIMPFDFSDAWDADRGVMFLTWGHEPEFVAWPDQPLFRVADLSKILDNPARFLKQKSTVKIMIDIDISFEESQYIKETYINEYSLRKLELVQKYKEQHAPTIDTENIDFKNIDQIVIDSLSSVDSQLLDPNTLIKIYQES